MSDHELQAMPAGIYAGKDGKRYSVMSDGTTYEIRPRIVWVEDGKGGRVRREVDGSMVKVGTARRKQHAVDSQGREQQDQDSQKRQEQTPVDTHREPAAQGREARGSGDPGSERSGQTPVQGEVSHG